MDMQVSRGNIHAHMLRIPASKSLSHRALIASALHQGTSDIRNLVINQDTEATMRALRCLGAVFCMHEGHVRVRGIASPEDYNGDIIDCGESGSTLRFLIPLLTLSGKEVRFTGHGRLMERPQSVYEELFAQQGIRFEKRDSILYTEGKLKSGEITLRGDVSSQFISGLLFALPLCEGDSVIHITPPYESRDYVGLTEDVLEKSGIRFNDEGLTIHVPGSQKYGELSFRVDGDDSQAAFFAVLSMLAGIPLDVLDMPHNSRQGDHVIVELIRRFGGTVHETDEGYRFEPGPLHGCEADLGNCPDLGPVLFALAARAEGESVFHHCGRLRIKESDRIECMRQELEKLGCAMYAEGDTVRIRGIADWHEPVVLSGHNDHRIVMALSVLACAKDIPLLITGAEAVRKSYPDFFRDLAVTGAEVKEV